MDWRRGIDRLSWYVAGAAFLAILGAITEDIWDDNEWGTVTSMAWTMIGGGSFAGAVVLLLAIRGIGWVVAGFLGDGKASRTEVELAGQEAQKP